MFNYYIKAFLILKPDGKPSIEMLFGIFDLIYFHINEKNKIFLI